MTETTDAAAGAEERNAGCLRVRARLAQLIDGGLAPLETARDRGHLEACAPCRDALRVEERLLPLLRAAAAERSQELRADVERVTAAVLAEIAAVSPARTRHAVVVPRRRAAAALLVAAAALLALGLLHARGPRAPARADLASLEPVLEHIPSLADVLRGLGNLSRAGS